MNMKKIFLYIVIAAIAVSCKPEIEDFVPSKGDADFSKYVSYLLDKYEITPLNSVKRSAYYPLSKKVSDEEILVRQGQFKIWSVLYPKHGLHQIPLEPASRPITAMSTPLGPRQWRVLPMG